MDTKSITAVIVGLMVAGLILVAFVPVFTEVTATEDTFVNDGYFRVNKITSADTDTYVLTWDVSEPNIITVNDVDSDISTWGNVKNMAFSIFATENDIFRIGVSPYAYDLSWVQIRGGTYNYVSASASFTATITGGNVTIKVDSDTTEYALTYSTAYIIDPSNTALFTMKKADEECFVLNDSEIYGMGITLVNNVSYVMKVAGTVDSGSNITVDVIDIVNDAPTITISNITPVTTNVSSYIDLMKLDKITFDATPEGGSASNCTYNYFVVPYEVTAEKSVHGDDVFNTVINIIPLLAGVGLLMAGVYYFISRKI